ncbi:insulinase family protein [Candidatus Saccharibacteria bacterium]|nr:insulinase family protein [Candidatus Saccharibacteria bacterium]
MKHTVSEVSLANGSKGLFIHIPDATVVSFQINFRAGEYLVERDKWETPHLMEHVLLGANEMIPKARNFQAEFEKNGAYSNASTGTYDITYEAECADFEWDRIASLLMIAISKPLFLEEEFQAEFGNVVEELNARSNNHFRELSLTLRNSFGFKVLTDHERLALINNVIISDIVTHYKKTHMTSNMRFVIAGKLPLERKKVLKQLLQSIELPKGDGRFELPNEKPRRLNAPVYIENKTIDNIYFYVDTFMNRRMSDDENDSLNLINNMMCETLHSKILGAAREKGLVYHMSSGIGQTYKSSNWWFGAQVLPKNSTELFNIMIKELMQVFEDKISEKDIKAAKQYALGRYQRSGQTVSGTAYGYANRYFFEEIIDDYYKIPERIEAVTRNRIVDISKALFAENVWGLGVLGNCGSQFVDDHQTQLLPLWQS